MFKFVFLVAFLAFAAAKPLVVEYEYPAYTAPIAAYSSPVAYSAYDAYTLPAYSAYTYASPYAYDYFVR